MRNHVSVNHYIQNNQIFSAFLLLLLLTAVLAVPVHADMGPKPSVNITVENPPSDACLATLLGSTETFGPYYLDENTEARYDGEALDAYNAFKAYAEEDEFFFWGEVFSVGEEGFSWRYLPPSPFKILIYDPADGRVYVSPEEERYAFDSYYSVRLAEDGTISTERTGLFFVQVPSILTRVIFTCLAEVGIAFLFGYKAKRELLMIAGVNVLTQVVLNVMCSWDIYKKGPFMWEGTFLAYEHLVFLIEAVLYIIFLRSHSKKRAVGYAFTANLATALLGMLLWALV